MDLSKAMDLFISELAADKQEGSYYHSWQSNLAMKIFDNSELSAEKCNDIAKKFLDYLIRVGGKCEQKKEKT